MLDLMVSLKLMLCSFSLYQVEVKLTPVICIRLSFEGHRSCKQIQLWLSN